MAEPDLGFQPTKIYKPTGKLEFTIPAPKVETPWWDFWSTNPSTGTTAISATPVAPKSTITTTPPKVPQSMWSGKYRWNNARYWSSCRCNRKHDGCS